MGIVSGTVKAAALVGGTAYAMGKLESMDSTSIRGVGSAVKGFVDKCGKQASETKLGRDILSWANENKYAKKALSVSEAVMGKGVDGFTAMMNALGDAKEKSEKDGSGFFKNVAEGATNELKGLVAEAPSFIGEKITDIMGIEKKDGAVAYTAGRGEAQAEESGPAFDYM